MATRVGKTRVEINTAGAKDAILEGIKDGLDKYAKMLMPIINERTPVDTGALRKSEKEESINDGMGKRFSANKEYALIQHENLEFKHLNGGTAKYLVNPLAETIEDAKKIISDSIKKKLN